MSSNMQVDDAVVPDVTTSSTELYERKRKQLFDSLCSAEKSIEGTILEQRSVVELNEERERRPIKRTTADVADEGIADRRFHGQESIFKKPPPGIMKCLKPRRTPGYQVNPHKWKKYSLSDADTSDRTNTAAAFEFLREIEERKRNESVGGGADGDSMDTSELDGGGDQKIVFKQRRRSDLSTKFNQSVSLKAQLGDSASDDGAEKAVLRGSKVVMPEYVIGQKVAKEKRVKQRSTSKADQNKLKLNHLFDEDDGE